MQLKIKVNDKYRATEIERDLLSLSWIEKHQREMGKQPPLPMWMHHFVNGQIAGEPIKQGMEIIYPSGQLWQSLTSQQRSELLELVEFNGQDVNEFIRGMEMQYPKTPEGK